MGNETQSDTVDNSFLYFTKVLVEVIIYSYYRIIEHYGGSVRI
jgi:hypothetical protein